MSGFTEGYCYIIFIVTFFADILLYNFINNIFLMKLKIKTIDLGNTVNASNVKRTLHLHALSMSYKCIGNIANCIF